MVRSLHTVIIGIDWHTSLITLNKKWGQKIHIQAYIHTNIPTNIWLNVPRGDGPRLDTFASYQQASGIILIGYFTSLFGRIGRLHLNWLASFCGSIFKA